MKLTRRGRVVAVGAAAMWLAALLTGSAAAAAAGLISVLAFSQAIVTVARPVVVVRRTLARDRFAEGEDIREEIAIQLLSPRRVQAELTESASQGVVAAAPGPVAVDLTEGDETTVELTWSARTWGRKELGPLRVVVHDAFGLLEAEVVDTGAAQFRVHPVPDPRIRISAKASNPEPSLGVHNVSRPGDGFEFFALREYQPGDSIRRINWKASARSESTIVNQVTRETFARIFVLLDLREKEALGDHEASASVANGRALATILAHHSRLRDHVNVIVVTDAARPLTLARNSSFADLVDALAVLEPAGDAPLHEAVRANLPLVRSRTPAYVLTSGTLDADLGEALGLLQASGARTQLIAAPLPSSEGLDGAMRARIQESRNDALAAARGVGAVVHEWARPRAEVASHGA